MPGTESRLSEVLLAIGATAYVEMISSTRAVEGRLYIVTTLLYIKDHEFQYLQGSQKQTPAPTEGWLQCVCDGILGKSNRGVGWGRRYRAGCQPASMGGQGRGRYGGGGKERKKLQNTDYRKYAKSKISLPSRGYHLYFVKCLQSSSNANRREAGEMGSWLKCLVHKRETWSWDLQNPCGCEQAWLPPPVLALRRQRWDSQSKGD